MIKSNESFFSISTTKTPVQENSFEYKNQLKKHKKRKKIILLIIILIGILSLVFSSILHIVNNHVLNLDTYGPTLTNDNSQISFKRTEYENLVGNIYYNKDTINVDNELIDNIVFFNQKLTEQYPSIAKLNFVLNRYPSSWDEWSNYYRVQQISLRDNPVISSQEIVFSLDKYKETNLISSLQFNEIDKSFNELNITNDQIISLEEIKNIIFKRKKRAKNYTYFLIKNEDGRLVWHMSTNKYDFTGEKGITLDAKTGEIVKEDYSLDMIIN